MIWVRDIRLIREIDPNHPLGAISRIDRIVRSLVSPPFPLSQSTVIWTKVPIRFGQKPVRSLEAPVSGTCKTYESLPSSCRTLFCRFCRRSRGSCREEGRPVSGSKARILALQRIRGENPVDHPIKPKNAPVMDPQNLQKPPWVHPGQPFAGFGGGLVARSGEKTASVWAITARISNRPDLGTGTRRSPDRAEKRSGYDPAEPTEASSLTFCRF
jgi:hypothetical protein